MLRAAPRPPADQRRPRIVPGGSIRAFGECARRVHRSGGQHRIGDRAACEEGVELAVDEPGVDVAGPKSGIRDQPRQKRDVGRDPCDLESAERTGEAIERHRAIVTMRDDLRDHRVVVGSDGIAFAHAAVDAYVTGIRWRREMREGAGGRKEPTLGILRIDPRFHRMAGNRQLRLPGW